jgi:DegV family protein with EDD domain
MKSVVVTDSASALPGSLVVALGIEVVSLRVLVDGEDREDGAVDGSWFYECLAAGAVIKTSQPSPGVILEAYDRMAATGAQQIWSIHVGSELSGTANAARVAARDASIPVEIVDSGTASMPLGLAVVAAALALRDDATANVREVVRRELNAQGNVFVSLTPELLERGGRGAGRFLKALPVLSITAGEAIEVVGSAADMADAVAILTEFARTSADGATIAVGEGGAASWGDALLAHTRTLTPRAQVFRYAVPASVGAHTGPSVGLVVSRSRLPAALLSAFGGGDLIR